MNDEGESAVSHTAESVCPCDCPASAHGTESCVAESFCYSSFQDDVGDEEKFMEMASLQLQNLLVCGEMFLAAVMHRSVFSYRDWKSAQKQSTLAGVRDMMPVDIARDLRYWIAYVHAYRFPVSSPLWFWASSSTPLMQ